MNVQLLDLPTIRHGIVWSSVPTELMRMHLEQTEHVWGSVPLELTPITIPTSVDLCATMILPYGLTTQPGHVWKHVRQLQICMRIQIQINVNLIVQTVCLLINYNVNVFQHSTVLLKQSATLEHTDAWPDAQLKCPHSGKLQQTGAFHNACQAFTLITQQWNAKFNAHQIPITTHLMILLWAQSVFCIAQQLIIDTCPTEHVYKTALHLITSRIQQQWNVLKSVLIIILRNLLDKCV